MRQGRPAMDASHVPGDRNVDRGEDSHMETCREAQRRTHLSDSRHSVSHLEDVEEDFLPSTSSTSHRGAPSRALVPPPLVNRLKSHERNRKSRRYAPLADLAQTASEAGEAHGETDEADEGLSAKTFSSAESQRTLVGRPTGDHDFPFPSYSGLPLRAGRDIEISHNDESEGRESPFISNPLPPSVCVIGAPTADDQVTAEETGSEDYREADEMTIRFASSGVELSQQEVSGFEERGSSLVRDTFSSHELVGVEDISLQRNHGRQNRFTASSVRESIVGFFNRFRGRASRPTLGRYEGTQELAAHASSSLALHPGENDTPDSATSASALGTRDRRTDFPNGIDFSSTSSAEGDIEFGTFAASVPPQPASLVQAEIDISNSSLRRPSSSDDELEVGDVSGGGVPRTPGVESTRILAPGTSLPARQSQEAPEAISEREQSRVEGDTGSEASPGRRLLSRFRSGFSPVELIPSRLRSRTLGFWGERQENEEDNGTQNIPSTPVEHAGNAGEITDRSNPAGRPAVSATGASETTAEPESEDDDPTCHQILCVSGFLFRFPFLWIVGAVLWYITPKEHIRSRKWGLANLALSIGSVTVMLIQIWSITEPALEKVVFLTNNSGGKSAEATGRRIPGFLQTISPGHPSRVNRLDWDMSDESLVNAFEELLLSPPSEEEEELTYRGVWRGARYPDAGRRTRKGEWVFGPIKVPLPVGRYPRKAFLGKPFAAVGRIQVTAVFGQGASPDADTTRKIVALMRSPDNAQPTEQSSFPPDYNIEEIRLTDGMFPAGFVGSGIRCLQPERASPGYARGKYVLLWRKYSGEAAEVSTLVIFFPEQYLCSIAIVSTVDSIGGPSLQQANLDGFVDTRRIALKALP